VEKRNKYGVYKEYIKLLFKIKELWKKEINLKNMEYIKYIKLQFKIYEKNNKLFKR